MLLASCNSLCSSAILYFMFGALLMLVSLSNVIGSIIIEERLRDLLMATYEIPRVLSFVPISTHDLSSVRPWLL